MKIRYIILTFLVAFITLSCEDWIELRPENSVTFENAFDTEKDIEAALFGTEQSLRVNMTAAPVLRRPMVVELQRHSVRQRPVTLSRQSRNAARKTGLLQGGNLLLQSVHLPGFNPSLG